MRYLLSITAILLLAACSITPEPLRDAPADSPTLSQLREAPQAYLDTALRWGGTIAKVLNTAEGSQVEIVARRLQTNGQPRREDHSEGRFIALVPNFLDPVIYSPGRQITVTGHFIGEQQRALGEMSYRYPQIEVSSLYLWPEQRPVGTPDPFHRDPWYPHGYPYWPMRDPYWSPLWHPYPW